MSAFWATLYQPLNSLLILPYTALSNSNGQTFKEITTYVVKLNDKQLLGDISLNVLSIENT